MTWILILFLSGNGTAVTNIPNFKTANDCEAAAKTIAGKVWGFRYACVGQSK